MVYEGVVLSLLVGWLRGGKFGNFAKIQLRWSWIFPILVAAWILALFFERKFPWVHAHSTWLTYIMYAGGLVFLLANRREAGFIWVFLGVFLNLLVIVANGGQMPVSETAIRLTNPHFAEEIQQIQYSKHVLMSGATRLPFLADVIPLARPYYIRTMIVSPGDVIISVGIFLYLQSVLLLHRRPQAQASRRLP